MARTLSLPSERTNENRTQGGGIGESHADMADNYYKKDHDTMSWMKVGRISRRPTACAFVSETLEVTG
jgi:hypothetical protein